MFKYYFWRLQYVDEATRNSREITVLGLAKRPLRRDQRNKSKHVATCATLVCILVCGSLLVGLGAALTCSGIFVPNLKGNPTPWLVTGSTCIVIGVLVLLLSVEIIIKKKKLAIDDATDGRVGKKTNMDITVKVKAWLSIIWHGIYKAKSTDVQGTSPPLAEHPIVEEQTMVGEFGCQSTSSYKSSTGSPKTLSKIKALTSLDDGGSLSLVLLDPSTLKHSWSTTIELEEHTKTSEQRP